MALRLTTRGAKLKQEEEPTGVVYMPLDKELAHRAFSGTSFDHEKRGDSQITEHKRIFEALQTELGDFFEQKHADKLHDLWTAYLASHSNVMSSMITGQSNFPTARNQKLSGWADKKHEAVNEYLRSLGKWHKKAEKKKKIEKAGGELAMKQAELVARKERHELMKAANRAIRSALKSKDGITEYTIEKLIRLGLKEHEAREVTTKSCYGAYGYESFMLTNSNARIKTLSRTVKELERREEAKESNVEPEVFSVPGGEVVFDFVENRANVIHEEKPDREIISLIKKHGFRWSRHHVCWTRKLTGNAQYSAKELVTELNSFCAE